jgi:membrane-associated phospholipid phosphatase
LARWVRQSVILAAIMLGALSLYLAVLKWRGPEGYDHITYISELDGLIPFQPAWVWVYLIPYLLGPIFIGLLSPETFAWYVRRGLLVVGVSLAVFIVYPTWTRERDYQVTGDSLTAQLYRNMAAIDTPPANAAPSLHVSLTCLLAWAFVRDFPRWWPLCFGLAIVVWLATLFTRQHHLIDVVTGAALGSVLALPWPGRKTTG